MSTSETQSASIKELHRSRDERILAGVAGGLGRYFDITPTFFRIGFAILALVGGAGILLYVAAWLVIRTKGRAARSCPRPSAPPRPSLAPGRRRPGRDRARLSVRAGGLGPTAVSRGRCSCSAGWRSCWRSAAPPTARRRTTAARCPTSSTTPGDAATPAARPRQPSLLLPGLGVLLAAAGALALLQAVGVDVRWDVALAVGAIGAGVAFVAGVALRRRTGGLVVVGLVLATLAIAVSAVDVRLEGPIGTRVYTPVETSDLKRDYDISMGDLRLDLSNAALAEGDTEVDANVGIGELTVIVPEDVALDVDASASAGQVTVFGRSESGVDADLSESISPPGGPTGRFASTHTSGSATSSWRRRSAMVDVGAIPARDRANGVVAGVAAGIGRALEVDPTLVRLLFALLALAGGAGIALDTAAALLMPDELGKRPGRARFAAGMALLLLAAVVVLNGLGLPRVRPGLRGPRRGGSLLSLAEAAARARRRSGRRRRCRALHRGEATQALDGPLLTPAAFAGGLLLVRAVAAADGQERPAERTRRIRSEERAEVAARLHDSGLQTFALIQRKPTTLSARAAGPPPGARAAAWLSTARAPEAPDARGRARQRRRRGRGAARRSRRARERWNAPLDDDTRALAPAAREAMVNAARTPAGREPSTPRDPDGISSSFATAARASTGRR